MGQPLSRALGAVVLALVVILLMFAWQRQTPEQDAAGSWRRFRSDRYGVTFLYPQRYLLFERDLSTPQRRHHAIVLTEDTPENRDLAAGVTTVPREGPPTISVELFQHRQNGETAERWVKETPDSHFALSSDRTLSRVPLAGEEALSYRWDGLYLGTSLVVARPDWIHLWSVTYLAPQDDIVRDFGQILETVEFAPPGVPRP